MEQQRAILDYHERSKHQLRRYAPGPGYLDWANQPDPFRTYAGAPRIALALAADETRTRFADVRAGRLPPAAPVTRETIGVLLELVARDLGLEILRRQFVGAALQSLERQPAPDRRLRRRRFAGLGRRGLPLRQPRPPARATRTVGRSQRHGSSEASIVGLASIYWREAWKYGMRAFRYCQHDCGHAIAAVSYAAASLGWQTRLLDSAGDDDVAALLGLDRLADAGPAEREEPDCLLWVGAGDPPAIDALVDAARMAHWAGRPNRLSAEHVDWPDIDLAHEATRKPRTAPAASIARASGALAAPKLDPAASTLFRQRRSAVDFDGATSISADAFYTMLEPLLPHVDAPPWNAWPWAAASASRPVRASRRGTGARALRIPAR